MTNDPPEDSSPIDVLYQDAHLIAVSKPAGWLSQGWKGGEISLEDRLRRQISPHDPANVYLGAVHRLDRPVSGVMLWALTSKAARRLSAQFAARNVQKRYWAIVEGTPPDVPPHWLDWLCEEDTGLGRVQVCASRNSPRPPGRNPGSNPGPPPGPTPRRLLLARPPPANRPHPPAPGPVRIKRLANPGRPPLRSHPRLRRQEPDRSPCPRDHLPAPDSRPRNHNPGPYPPLVGHPRRGSTGVSMERGGTHQTPMRADGFPDTPRVRRVISFKKC